MSIIIFELGKNKKEIRDWDIASLTKEMNISSDLIWKKNLFLG